MEKGDREKVPDKVKTVSRFLSDLQALEELTEALHQPRIPARPTATACAAFGFGDASGAGFGQSLWLMGEEDIDVFYGLWEADISKGSLNWREFYNQVISVERGIEMGMIP